MLEQYAVLLVGDSGVGKSSLMHQFAEHTFSDTYTATIGIDDAMHTVDSITLQISTASGQERYKTITRSLYSRTQGVMVVYDVTKRESFDNVKKWLHEIDEFAEENENIKKVMVGNKSDLSSLRQVDRHEAQHFADASGVTFVETSAKTSSNVGQAFLKLTFEIKAQAALNRCTS